MSHGHDHDHPAPDLAPRSVDQLRQVLLLLGYQPCEVHAPDDPQERVAGDLAVVLAMTQAHISQLPRDLRGITEEIYHNMREHVLGVPCPCGGHHDEREHAAREGHQGALVIPVHDNGSEPD